MNHSTRRKQPLRRAISLTGALALLALASHAPAAHANDTHYQNLLLGQRAMGMGGAFVALADDPSASFYNPGGLALSADASASASLGIYGIERRTVDGGFGNALQPGDLSQTSFPIVATTFSAMARFGSGDEGRRHAVGISLFLPFSDSTSYNKLVVRGSEASTYQMTENDRTFWVGPSYARRFRKDFALGFSLFYENRGYQRISDFSSFFSTARSGQLCPGTTTACSLASNIDANMGSLFLRVGALWKLDETWRFGVAFSTPNLHVHGGANITSRRFSAGAGGSAPVEYFVAGLADQAAFSRRPFEIRVGAAYQSEGAFTLSFDVSLHGPLTYNRLEIEGLITDPLLVREVRRDAVVNINVGAELYPTPKVPLRFGIFTNFSSAPEIPELTSTPFLPRIHLFGASMSIGYRGGGYGVDFGITAQFGNGVMQAFDTMDQSLLRRAGMNSTLVYFFVSGIGSAIAKNIEKLLDTIK